MSDFEMLVKIMGKTGVEDWLQFTTERFALTRQVATDKFLRGYSKVCAENILREAKK